MRFFELLDNLKQQYADNYVVRENGTLLLGPGKIPRSKHMLFKPLKDEYIKEFLVSQYANEFPTEYVKFLKYSNGAVLYTIRLKKPKFEYAFPLFVILGLPLTSPFDRPKDMEEPYDVRIEDLDRHKDLPQAWLKCGKYVKEYKTNTRYDIFIDTTNGKVYSCKEKESVVEDSWENLDECFCTIFETFFDCKEEYIKE